MTPLFLVKAARHLHGTRLNVIKCALTGLFLVKPHRRQLVIHSNIKMNSHTSFIILPPSSQCYFINSLFSLYFSYSLNSVERRRKGLRLLPHLAGVGDGLQLQGGQPATVDGLLGNGQPVPHIWWVHTGQRASLNHRVRVPQACLHCREREKRGRGGGSRTIPDIR